jgi:uncharacterized protein
MNKPATKDPSMDEILSSIRQIIADDDEGDSPLSDEASGVEEAADAQLSSVAADDEEDAPLALSPEQLVAASSAPAGGAATPKSQEEDLPDISFNPSSSGMDVAPPKEPEPEPSPEPVVEEMAAPDEEPAVAFDVPEAAEAVADVELVVADDIAFEDSDPAAPEETPSAPVAMPDPDLSADMAEKLLAPTTDAAVRHTFARLGSVPMGGSDLTLEAIVREMLRPMLKEWLDENLPATVERMVEKEIARVSRGE